MKKCAIVITSIFDNGWIERVSEEITRSSEIENTSIIYICDYKTPSSVFEKIRDAKSKGVDIYAPTMTEQLELESKLDIKNFLLANSDHRRNLGYLLAWKNGYDFVISMDDDNYPLTANYINEHRKRLGKITTATIYSSRDHVFNNCSLLEKNTHIHPRGFPFKYKSKNYEYNSCSASADLNVAVNAGMWTISPDVDAISWLISNKTFTDVKDVDDIVLSEDTFCPINSQNTALLSEYIPAYYFVRMGYDIGGGLKFDRLGDIYSGYFLQKVAKHLGSYVSFGLPLVTHERNSHDYLNDSNNEWGCLRTIDEFFDWLVNAELQGATVIDTYISLAENLHEFASTHKFKFMPTATSGFYHQMAYDMKRWSKLLRDI